MTEHSDHRVCGIDASIVEEFLTLLRDRYASAEKANYFLELKTGISAINTGITNQRDALSHLVTLLNHPEWSREEQEKQYGNIEEHLRRATIEPYETALAEKWKEATKCLKQYRESVLPLLHISSLAGAPEAKVIRSRLEAVSRARATSRMAKAENTWNEVWEDGVKALIEAFDETTAIMHELQDWIDRANQERELAKSARRHRTQVWIALGLFVLAAVLAIALTYKG